MEPKQYIKSVLVTEATDFDAIKGRLSDTTTIRLMHAKDGIVTEAGEIATQLKKHIFYGKPLDKVNLIEEMGDLFWYLALMCDVLGIPFEQVWDLNIAKLRARYGDKFSEARADVRDLDQGARNTGRG